MVPHNTPNLEDPVANGTGCDAGDTPLTREALEQFIREDAQKHSAGLARRFLKWAAARSIQQADARDSIQDVLLSLLRRMAEGQATARHLEPGMLFVCGMRDAVRKHCRSQGVLAPIEQADHSHSRVSSRHQLKEA